MKDLGPWRVFNLPSTTGTQFIHYTLVSSPSLVVPPTHLTLPSAGRSVRTGARFLLSGLPSTPHPQLRQLLLRQASLTVSSGEGFLLITLLQASLPMTVPVPASIEFLWHTYENTQLFYS